MILWWLIACTFGWTRSADQDVPIALDDEGVVAFEARLAATDGQALRCDELAVDVYAVWEPEDDRVPIAYETFAGAPDARAVGEGTLGVRQEILAQDLGWDEVSDEACVLVAELHLRSDEPTSGRLDLGVLTRIIEPDVTEPGPTTFTLTALQL